MPYLYRNDTVFILDLGEPGQVNTENRISPKWMTQVTELLDEAEASTGPAALVTTGTGKFYSNGFEPERFDGEREDVDAYLLAAQQLYSRLLTFSMPTVAAVQGHAYAAGAIFAMTHDTRIMRADRGFFCLPEIVLDLALPGGLIVPPAMAAMLMARMPAQAAHESILAGRRYGGQEALAAGIVQAVSDEENLLREACAHAASIAVTRGERLEAMKKWMYRDVCAALTTVS